MVRQSSLSYFCGRNRNTLAPYRDIFINFFLFPLLFPICSFLQTPSKEMLFPDLPLQLDSFPFSPFLFSSQGEEGANGFRRKLWPLMSGYGGGGSFGSKIFKVAMTTPRGLFLFFIFIFG